MLDRPAKMTDFLPMEIIGEGGHGTVIKVKLRNKPNLFMAMKKIEKGTLESEPGAKEQLISEVEIMESLNHPNILEFYGYFEDSRHVNLLLEYSEEGCLFSDRDSSTYSMVTTLIVCCRTQNSTWPTCSRLLTTCTPGHQLSCTETSNLRIFWFFQRGSS